MIYTVYNFELGRGGYAIKMLFDDPKLLFLVDASVGTRIYGVVLAVLSVFEHPFGMGTGTYSMVQMSVEKVYKISDSIATDGFGNVFAFAKYSVEIGVVFWMMIYYFFIKSIYAGKFPFFVLGLGYTLGFPISFPPIWFLFLIAIQKTEKM